MEYRHGSHTVCNIEYHFVWITKYRYQVLVGELKTRRHKIARQICPRHELNILKGHVSKDHARLLVSSPPRLAPSQLTRKIKGRSSRLLQREFPHLKKRYWGQHIWAWGYFCATVGE